MTTAELCCAVSLVGWASSCSSRHVVHQLSTPPIGQKRDGTGHVRPDIKNNSHDSRVNSALLKDISVNAGTMWF
jgi:hypothetical protein